MSEGDAYLASGPRCKKCDGEIERIIQKTSFELKGMGWEKDGYM
jgi:predicted nucleic acid-binding Zn ribbon protein